RMRRFNVAAVQLRSTDDRERNLRAVERYAAEAADQGADLVAYPENVAYLRPEGSALPPAEPLSGPTSERFSTIASRHRLWVLAGTIAVKSAMGRKRLNASILFDPDGAIAAVYGKMHLFDVAIPGRAEFRESRTIVPGDAPVVVDTPLGRLGLSIC